MPVDINLLREYKGGDIAAFRESQRRRFKPAEHVDELLAADEAWRALVQENDDTRKAVNKLQKEVIGPARGQGCEAAVAEKKTMLARVKEIDALLPGLVADRDKKLGRLGNLIDHSVPVSHDEDNDNEVYRLFPMPPNVKLPAKLPSLSYALPARKPLTHDDLLWRIGGYEPDRGSRVAGHRGYFLRDAGVMLNQAIINYALAFLRNREYSTISTPFFMKRELMHGIAQLEDYDEQLYKVQGKTDDPDDHAGEKYVKRGRCCCCY